MQAQIKLIKPKTRREDSKDYRPRGINWLLYVPASEYTEETLQEALDKLLHVQPEETRIQTKKDSIIAQVRLHRPQRASYFRHITYETKLLYMAPHKRRTRRARDANKHQHEAWPLEKPLPDWITQTRDDPRYAQVLEDYLKREPHEH